MANEELKKELERLKKVANEKAEKERLQNEIKKLKEKTEKPSTLQKVGKTSFKVMAKLGKSANTFFENQSKKMDNKTGGRKNKK